jgi:CCR4-NOT transcription complex subunit 4
MFAQNEINRMMFNQQYSQRMNHNNGADMNHVHPSMSKFFDFHKNQQQQQQNQFMMNSNPMTEQLNMANLLDTHRMNGSGSGGFMDQPHMQKQRLMNGKYDGGNGGQFNSQQNRMHNTPSQQYINPSVEDDLGFDPFKETQKALAELINDEVSQQQQQQMNGGQRSRMPPPPGFNHIQNSSFNSFGAGASPRSQCEYPGCLNGGNGSEDCGMTSEMRRNSPQR